MASDGMTTAANLLALAQRVEREEPSVNLDRAVWQAVGGKPENSIWDDYTSSRDAAASLSRWQVLEIAQCYEGWRVQLWLGPAKIVHSIAPDEPRARTAAALRAMAQEARDE